MWIIIFADLSNGRSRVSSLVRKTVPPIYREKVLKDVADVKVKVTINLSVDGWTDSHQNPMTGYFIAGPVGEFDIYPYCESKKRASDNGVTNAKSIESYICRVK